MVCNDILDIEIKNDINLNKLCIYKFNWLQESTSLYLSYNDRNDSPFHKVVKVSLIIHTEDRNICYKLNT